MKYPYPVINRNIYKYDDMKRGEHMAVRTTVGWYLWTHQLVEVTGADCVAFLEMIFPKRIGTLAVGRERYTTMLDEQGIIIDDVVVFRMGRFARSYSLRIVVPSALSSTCAPPPLLP